MVMMQLAVDEQSRYQQDTAENEVADEVALACWPLGLAAASHERPCKAA